MKIKDISFRPVTRAHEKGVFVGYANLTLVLDEQSDIAMTLYNVELTVWDDNGFAVRTPRHQAERNNRWYTDCFLSDTFRERVANALLKVPAISEAAIAAAEQRDGSAKVEEEISI